MSDSPISPGAARGAPRSSQARIEQHLHGAAAALDVVPVDGPLGAEIRGLDIAQPLDAATIRAIEDAWSEHLVLVFRDQHLSIAQHLAFAAQFGEILEGNQTSRTELSHQHRGLLEVSTVDGQGRQRERGLGSAEAFWHTDMSYKAVPPAGSFLFSREVPSVGGNTCFSNMYIAYETLPADLARAIEGRSAVHDESRNSAGRMRPGYVDERDPSKTPGPRHPLVRTHPVTGRKALFLGRRPYSFVPGLDVTASEALLDRLWAHASQPRLAWCHQWRVGDMVMWDNRCTMHRRDEFEPGARRVMHRTQTVGTVPV
ncbi:MAG: TauD/TfdA family dioxygenase [Gammaproteobacteria bacterium]|nr:TauD/TfdA family dioxygenase [Gammaproteobacteria bacterium]